MASSLPAEVSVEPPLAVEEPGVLLVLVGPDPEPPVPAGAIPAPRNLRITFMLFM